MSTHHDPSVLRRMLALRQFPLLAGIERADLAVFAENVIETTLPAGAVIAAARSRLGALHFVLEGQIESADMSWGPREVCGVIEVLARRSMSAPAIATTEVRTLQLSSGELGEILEDNFGVMSSVVRELAGRALAIGLPRTRAPRPLVTAGPLGLVERLIVLRQQVPFARAGLQALATLAHDSEELILPPGATLARTGEAASRAFVVVEGTLHARQPNGMSSVHGIGDAIGLFETLASAPHGSTVEALTQVRALASTGAALFDVLEDHGDVGLAMLATLAGAMLDAPAIQSAGSLPAAPSN